MEGYQKQRRQRKSKPIVLAGCEGETEMKYVETLVHKYGLTFKKLGPCNNPLKLLESTVIEAAKQRRTRKPQDVIALIVLDIEIMSDIKIKQHQQLVAQAHAKGVHVVINRPKIENWFAQHFDVSPENTSPLVVDAKLKKHVEQNNLSPYEKPGNAAFHSGLSLYVQNAVENCAASGHSQHNLPCFCKFIELLETYQ